MSRLDRDNARMRRMDAQAMAGNVGRKGGRGRYRVVQVQVIEPSTPRCSTPSCKGNPALSGEWNGKCQRCNGETP